MVEDDNKDNVGGIQIGCGARNTTKTPPNTSEEQFIKFVVFNIE
jgi:hypothetical protein